MAGKSRKHEEVVQEARSIARSIKAKELKPLYLFHGEESYYIDLLTKLIAEEVLEAHERDFNQTTLYASDTKPEDVANLARQYPLMAPYQVIIVKEAQMWRSFDDLLPLATHPVPTSVVALTYKGKNFDKRLNFYKAVAKVGVAFQSDKLTEWDVSKWVHKYCLDHKLNIEDRAAAILSDYIGNHIGDLTNALDKLALVCKDAGIISEAAVMENIGISKDFNVFELNKALGERKASRAAMIANYFANNEKEHHVIPTVSMVYYYFRKIATYQDLAKKMDRKAAAQAIGVYNQGQLAEYANAASKYPLRSLVQVFEILHDIDLKSKGVGNAQAGSGELVREMVGRILVS